MRDFRYPRSRAASAAILSVAVILLAAFCRVGVAVDVRVRDLFLRRALIRGIFLTALASWDLSPFSGISLLFSGILSFYFL